MAKIDPADIWTISKQAYFKPGSNSPEYTFVFRKKHARVSTSDRAKAVRERFRDAAESCKGRPIGEFLACMRRALGGKAD